MPIAITEPGIVMPVKAEQKRKALSPIVARLSERVTLVKAEQLAKAKSPRISTELAILTVSRRQHDANAAVPMDVIGLGM